MNRRVEKPKRGIPLTKVSAPTDARMDKYLRENHAAVDSELQAAKRAIDRGEATPLESLPELLKIVRRARKPQR